MVRQEDEKDDGSGGATQRAAGLPRQREHQVAGPDEGERLQDDHDDGDAFTILHDPQETGEHQRQDRALPGGGAGRRGKGMAKPSPPTMERAIM